MNFGKWDLSKHIPLQYVIIAVIAIVRAALNEIFIYPNNFAPAGVAGIATMVQYALNIEVGYFYLALNIPLLLLAYKFLHKKFATKTLTYILFFAAADLYFHTLDWSGIMFCAKDSGDAIMAAIAGGVIAGLEYSTCIRLQGSTGGTDIISAYVNNKAPQYDMVWINFTINASVALASFFVYGRNYTAVILCIIYIFVNTRLSDTILKGIKTAIKFEVFTDCPDEMAAILMERLKHGCTVIRGQGMYSHTEKDMLICVVNKGQIVDFERIINKFPGSFAIISSVNSTYGNFKRIK